MIQLHDHSSDAPEKFNPFKESAAQAYLWRDLYLQAIFERERAKIPEKIREAERALMHREHELCTAARHSAERESVITALNCLDALRSCVMECRGVQHRSRP